LVIISETLEYVGLESEIHFID